MNNIEGTSEASDIPEKDNTVVPDIANTDSAAAVDDSRVSSSSKLRPLEVDEDSLYKRIVYHKLKLPAGKLPSSKSESRYKIKKLIGEGSIGNIFSAQDFNFDREVALKVPKKTDSSGHGRDDFIKEATVSAGLEHPNIIPVYDLNLDNNGNIYMSMRKVNGHSLKEYIDSVKDGDGTLQLMKIEEILLIFLKICDAVAYAHSKGHIHQDIKPENIMIGGFGEVFLIDWGSSSSDDEEICLTPAYMSPEQASTGYADERSDVFCLAATLFHVLMLRLPTVTETTRELWTKRCQGIIDPLTDKERKKVPPQLMAIVMKGIEANPDKRYQTIAEFSQDLKQYQGGLAVSAFQDTLFACFMRWYRRNRKFFWMSLLVLFVVAAFGAYIWDEKLKEIAYWGRPVCVERFNNSSWKDRWIEYQGAFEAEDGRLVTVPGKGDAYILVFREKLSGSIAIEFDGEIMPGTLPCDLSVIWAEDMTWDKDKKNLLNINDTYYLQTGACDNNFSRILKNSATLSYSKLILQEGRKYKIRAEIDGVFMRLFVDGKLVCQYNGPFPMRSGYVGLYGFYPGKAFGNIKIYCKGVPEKVSATYIGDVLYTNGMFENAFNSYQEVLRSHEGKIIADEARYKAGLCLYSMGKKDQAYELWKTIKADEYRRQAAFQFWIKQALENGVHDQVIKEMEEMYGKSNVRQQQEIINAWGTLVGMIAASSRYNSLDKYLELRQKLFKDDISQKQATTQLLLSMGRYAQIIEEYPELKYDCADALLASGRPEEILEKYPDLRNWCAKALIALGRSAEVLEKYPDLRSLCAEALFASGRSEKVLEKYPDLRDYCANALLVSGHPEEVLEKYPDQRNWCAKALFASGRLEQILEKYPDQRDLCAEALIASGRSGEVFGKYPDLRILCAKALLVSGRPEEILEKYPDQRNGCAYALLALGRPEKVLEKYPDNKVSALMANYCIGFKLLEAGDYGKAKELLSSASGQSVSRYYYMSRFANVIDLPLAELIYLPFTEYLINPALPLEQRLKDALATKEQFCQVLWFQASFILGNISEEQFLKQPEKIGLESRLILAKALKAEYGKEKSEALQYYTAYNALPAFKKALNPAVDAFVKWRIMELTKKKREAGVN